MARQRWVCGTFQPATFRTSCQAKKTARRPPWDNSFALPQKYEKPPRIFYNKPTEEELLLKRLRLPTSKWTVTHEIYKQPLATRNSPQSISYKSSLSKKSSPTNAQAESDRRLKFDTEASKKPKRGSGRHAEYRDSPYAQQLTQSTKSSKVKNKKGYSERRESNALYENTYSKSRSGQKRRPTNIPKYHDDEESFTPQSSKLETKMSSEHSNDLGERVKQTYLTNDGDVKRPLSKQSSTLKFTRKLYKAKDSIAVVHRPILYHPANNNDNTISIRYGKRTSSEKSSTPRAPKAARRNRGGLGRKEHQKQVHNANGVTGGESPMYACLVNRTNKNMVHLKNLCDCDAKEMEKKAPLGQHSEHRLKHRLADIGKELGHIVGI